MTIQELENAYLLACNEYKEARRLATEAQEHMVKKSSEEYEAYMAWDKAVREAKEANE